jgi:2'-5' RNA ligase
VTETALLVPVPEAEEVTSRWWPFWEPAKAEGIPPHITLLYPFLPPERLDASVLAELGGLFGASASFRFTLAGTGLFQEEFLYLAPEPAEPFVRLTEALVARWPEAPPYSGTVDTITPHLTAMHHRDGVVLESTAREFETELPIGASACEVWLMARDGAGWSLLHRFSLGHTGVA